MSRPGQGARLGVVLIGMLIVAACGTTPTHRPATASPAASAGASFTALEAARDDLDRLLQRLEAQHPEPFHGVDRASWRAELEGLRAELPSLDPFEAQVELQRLVALLSQGGRDGHQFALPVEESAALPIRVHEFDEGVFVTAALPPHEDLVGWRIDAVNARPIDEVLAALEPLVPRDGPASVPGFRPIFLTRVSVLRGLGIVDPGPVRLDVSEPGGGARPVMLAPVPFDDWAGWARDHGELPLPVLDAALPLRSDLRHLSRPDQDLWSEVLEPSGTLYVRYRRVTPVTAADAGELLDAAGRPEIGRVVLDLRHNPGGDNTVSAALRDVLRDPAIDRPGRLVVLIDRLTFSAAVNLATELDLLTGAAFAGEATAGSPNLWGDARPVRLRHWPVPMEVFIATRAWLFAPGDPRLAIEPEIPVRALAADYFAGRDAVLDAVLGGATGG